ncbi:MAG: hypothetical protein HXY34_03050 [Candidatus Thorarchaeota archaeon]|nr:hypothetical protein [Candidatus Thorarchaeota archaeon]
MTDKNTVIIDLEESERTQTGELSEIVSVEASGVLSVKNVSDKNRIWNVRVHVAGSRDKTSISEDVIGVGEVDAGGTWQTQYQIQIDRPILTLTETFDTCCSVSTPEAHWAYVHGKENPVRITLRVKNESDGQLDALVINKTVPPELSNIRIENVQSGNASFDESLRVIVWKDFIIYPHEDSVLTVTATGTVDTTDPKNAGEVSVTYRGESLQRSSLDPDLTALTDFMTGI